MLNPGRRRSLRIHSKRPVLDLHSELLLPHPGSENHPASIINALRGISLDRAWSSPSSSKQWEAPSTPRGQPTLLPLVLQRGSGEHPKQADEMPQSTPKSTDPPSSVMFPRRLTPCESKDSGGEGGRETACATSLTAALSKIYIASRGGDVSRLLRAALFTALDGLQHDDETSANGLLECVIRLSHTASAYLIAQHPVEATDLARKVRFSCTSPPRDGDAESWFREARATHLMLSLLELFRELVSFKGTLSLIDASLNSKEYSLKLGTVTGHMSSSEVVNGIQHFLASLCTRTSDFHSDCFFIAQFQRSTADKVHSLIRALLRRLFDARPVPRGKIRFADSRRPSLCGLTCVPESMKRTQKRPLSEFPVVEDMSPSSLFTQALRQIWALYGLFADTLWLDDDTYDYHIKSLSRRVEDTILSGSPFDCFLTARTLVGACRAGDFVCRILKETYRLEISSSKEDHIKFWEEDESAMTIFGVWHRVEGLCKEITRYSFMFFRPKLPHYYA